MDTFSRTARRTLFEEPFRNQTALENNWLVAPGMEVQDGVLAFSPGHYQGFCVGLTRRADFRDVALTVDVRIVSSAAGLVLRAVSPNEYYMVQFDLANNPSVVWFHTFTPNEAEGYRVALVPTAVAPREGDWHRMRVVARDYRFEVLLGEAEGPLQPCATWEDSSRMFRQGAVGLWEHGGEEAEYRALVVEDLTSVQE